MVSSRFWRYKFEDLIYSYLPSIVYIYIYIIVYDSDQRCWFKKHFNRSGSQFHKFMLRFFVFHCLARLNAALKSNTVDCLLCTGQKTRNPPRQVAPCCSMECMYNNSIRSRTHRGYCFNRLLVYYWWNVVDMNVFCLTFTIVVLGTNNSLWLKSFVPQSSMYSNMKGIFPALFFFQMCISYTYIGHVRVYQGYHVISVPFHFPCCVVSLQGDGHFSRSPFGRLSVRRSTCCWVASHVFSGNELGIFDLPCLVVWGKTQESSSDVCIQCLKYRQRIP